MKISEVLKEGTELLNKNKIEDAKINARRLLAHTLNKEKEYLIIHDNEEVTDELYRIYKTKLERLISHEPIQYILNLQEFMGYDFYVDKNVLIPQPDTEILVQEAIYIVKEKVGFQNKAKNGIKNDEQNKEKNNKQYNEPNDKKIGSQSSKIEILDLCTGSGAIAVSLSKILENVSVFASDISEGALKIAQKNALKNNANVTFLKSNMFENISQENKFNIIVSNPPYIETEVIKTLSKEVKNEPILALDGGKDGLDFYKNIAKNAKSYLKENGYLALEIGYNQKESVQKILKENGYKNIYSKKDLSGNDRVVVAKK
jgi:release factor glutamine methyltransferase